ncbi:MAG: glycosyltransferase [Candidatus Accumulibacter sp.]|jgi:glycosyltransferase involved in cell wall biosynthesis|nr:glycosyltransferase [Accumulibacter sp.]
MKVLALSSTKRQPDFSTVFEHLGKAVDLDLKMLDKDAQQHLRRFLSAIDCARYDRILVDLRFKYIHRQTRLLSTLPGLLVYEEDACQNYIESSQWRGAFSRFYRKLPNARVVVTGFSVAERLAREGFAVHFIPKGYDPETVFFENGERDIEAGFIGRIGSAVYKERRSLLERLAVEESLQILRTETGAPYRKMLNRIRCFISADIGLTEYMAKNFEAMACGCVLLAYRQGSEEAAIGLEDGVHLLLYSDMAELRGHLAELRGDPALAQRIAEEGRKFVERSLSHPQLAARLAKVLEMPWPTPEPLSRWQTFLDRINPF